MNSEVRRFWWVNHNRSAREELSGGYLWSPRREAGGARSQFYDNMRIAAPGDVVLSYAGSTIGHVGRVRDYAKASVKPIGFESIESNWSQDGWILPVYWTALQEPVRPMERGPGFLEDLPRKYSPFNPVTLRGNQKAYLAEVSESVVNSLIGDQVSIAYEASLEPKKDPVWALEDAIERMLEQDVSLDATTREQTGLARLKQGLFRRRVLEMGRRCPITGIETPNLLIASHIKPWRACNTAAERLDGANGLPLAPHVDHLFDAGYISFSDAGDVLISPRIDPDDLRRLGLSEVCKVRLTPFNDRQRVYLAFHRDCVLLK